jgi:predicted PurR-regulated permease PerM
MSPGFSALPARAVSRSYRRSRPHAGSFVLVVLAGIYFFHGFLVPVLAALVIAFASWPLYSAPAGMQVDGSRTTRGLASRMLLILAFLIGPIVIASHLRHSTKSATGSAGPSRPTGTGAP